MGYEIENKIEAEEGLSADETKVRELLGGMKRVGAPKDFGFKVQARIANAKPEAYRETAGSWVFLRYAAPLALVLVVTSAFVISGIYRVDDNSLPAVAEIQNPAPQTPVASINAEKDGDIPIPGIKDPQGNTNSETVKKPGEELRADVPRKPLGNSPKDAENTGGGSFVEGSKEPPKFFEIPGAASRPAPDNIESPGQIPVEQILKIVGISATFSDQGWRVNSVATQSLSERSGIKRGDLIEAINGQPVTQGTKFSRSFNGQSLTVKRGGEVLNIALR